MCRVMELSVRNRELDFGNVCELECVCVHNNKKIKSKRNAQAFGLIKRNSAKAYDAFIKCLFGF